MSITTDDQVEDTKEVVGNFQDLPHLMEEDLQTPGASPSWYWIVFQGNEYDQKRSEGVTKEVVETFQELPNHMEECLQIHEASPSWYWSVFQGNEYVNKWMIKMKSGLSNTSLTIWKKTRKKLWIRIQT